MTPSRHCRVAAPQLTFCLVLMALSALCQASFAESVSGTVVNAAGQAVSGAIVTIEPHTNLNAEFGLREGLVTTSCDADGKFAANIAPSDSFWGGGLYGTASARIAAPGYGLTDVTLFTGENRIVLPPAFTASGFVTDENGVPLPGVRIAYDGHGDDGVFRDFLDNEITEVQTVSGADGTWRISGLPSGSPVEIGIDDPRYARCEKPAVPGVALHLTADKGTSITGLARTKSGVPIPGVWVTFQSRIFHSSPRPIQAGPDGRFKIDGLSGDFEKLLMYDPSGQFAGQPVISPRGHPGTGITAPDFIAQATVSVTGRIVSSNDNLPVANCFISHPYLYCAPTAASNQDGRFILHCLTGSDEILLAPSSGNLQWRTLAITIPPNAKGFDLGTIVLQPGVFLAGTVRDAKGEPLSGTKLEVEGSSMPDGTVSDPDGHFSLAPLPPAGKLTIRPLNVGGMATFSTVTPGLSQNAPPLDITLKDAGTSYSIIGKVTDPEGNPLPNAVVQMSLNSSDQFVSLATGSDGVFQLRHLRGEGEAQIRALILDGYEIASLPTYFSTMSDQAFNLCTMVKMGASYAGMVVDQTGKPVAGAWVTPISPVRESEYGQPAQPLFQTSADGRYSFTNCPEANVRIAAACGALYGEVIPVTGRAGRIQLAPPPVLTEAARSDIISGFPTNGADSLEPYADFLGEDGMLDVWRHANGYMMSIGSNWPLPPGTLVAGWISDLCDRDSVRAAVAGPGMLARWALKPQDPGYGDTVALWDDARARVAAACALHPAPEGTRFANNWINQQKTKANAANLELEFQLAGMAWVLHRWDAHLLMNKAIDDANREPVDSQWDLMENCGQSLALGGPAALDNLERLKSDPLRVVAWSGSIELQSRENLWAAEQDFTRFLAEPAIRRVLPADIVKADSTDAVVSAVRAAKIALLHGMARASEAQVLGETTGLKGDETDKIDRELALSALARDDTATARAALIAEANMKPETDAKYDLDAQHAYCASLAFSFDPKLGRQLFAKIAPQDEDQDTGSYEDYYYYHACIDPAASRLYFERQLTAVDSPFQNRLSDPIVNARAQCDSRNVLVSDLFPLTHKADLEVSTDNMNYPEGAEAQIVALAESRCVNWTLLPP